MMAIPLKILVLGLLLLTSTSCHLMWRVRGPCSFWPMPDPPLSGERMPQTFSSAEGRFRIGLPPKNESSSRTFEWFVFNQGHYQLSYFDSDKIVDTPDVSKTVLDNIRELVRSKRSGELEVDSELSLAGHPGREIRVKDDTGIQIDRFYLAGNRIYVISVFVSKRLDCKTDSAVKVLDTFEITEENATPTVLNE